MNTYYLETTLTKAREFRTDFKCQRISSRRIGILFRKGGIISKRVETIN